MIITGCKKISTACETTRVYVTMHAICLTHILASAALYIHRTNSLHMSLTAWKFDAVTATV